MGSLFNGSLGVEALGGDNAVVAPWNLSRARCRPDFGGKFCRAGNLQATLVDGLDVVFSDIKSVHFDAVNTSQMGGKEAADGATANHAHFHEPFTSVLLGQVASAQAFLFAATKLGGLAISIRTSARKPQRHSGQGDNHKAGPDGCDGLGNQTPVDGL